MAAQSETEKVIRITESTQQELIRNDYVFNAGQITKLQNSLALRFPALDPMEDSEAYLNAGSNQVKELEKKPNHFSQLMELLFLLAVESRRARQENVLGEALIYDNQLSFVAYLVFLTSNVEEIAIFDFLTFHNPGLLSLLDTRDA